MQKLIKCSFSYLQIKQMSLHAYYHAVNLSVYLQTEFCLTDVICCYIGSLSCFTINIAYSCHILPCTAANSLAHAFQAFNTRYLHSGVDKFMWQLLVCFRNYFLELNVRTSENKF